MSKKFKTAEDRDHYMHTGGIQRLQCASRSAYALETLARQIREAFLDQVEAGHGIDGHNTLGGLLDGMEMLARGTQDDTDEVLGAFGFDAYCKQRGGQDDE